MKKFIIPLTAVLLMLAFLPVIALNGSAENSSHGDAVAISEESIPENTLITYGYLEQFREELKQEIIAELTASGGITVATAYNDISAREGQVIILAPDSELIYRGGGAVAITASNASGEGITDMSAGRELFSGERLEYGHIYYASESESRRAVLVTGSTAYFTVRGEYEISE